MQCCLCLAYEKLVCSDVAPVLFGGAVSFLETLVGLFSCMGKMGFCPSEVVQKVPAVHQEGF